MPASCAANTYCASGTTSTDQSFQSCLKWCDLSVFNCPPGYNCLPNRPAAIVGPREYGLCLPQ